MAKTLAKNGAAPTAEETTPAPQGKPVDTSKPERQLMIRVWQLEDENEDLRRDNAALQTALAKATAGHTVGQTHRDLAPDVTGDAST